MESSSTVTVDIDEEKVRCRALHVIFKYSKCENFDPVVPYLAMTYFDRFISRSNMLMPRVMGTDVYEHDVELVALCCLTLAWKFRTKSFTISELQRNQPDIKDVTIEKFRTMEPYIFKELGWGLYATTALCFVPSFATKFCMGFGFSPRTIYEIIIHSQDNNMFRTLNPTVVAASAFLAASSFLYPEKYQSFYDLMKLEGLFNQRDERRCIDYMIKLCRDLKLVIESDKVPKRRVIPGERPEQGAAETPEQSNQETSSVLDFPLKWRSCRVYGEKFVIFRPLSESAELDQIAHEISDQVQPGLKALTQHQRSFRIERVDTRPEALARPRVTPEIMDQMYPQRAQMARVKARLNGLLGNSCCSPCSCCIPL